MAILFPKFSMEKFLVRKELQRDREMAIESVYIQWPAILGYDLSFWLAAAANRCEEYRGATRLTLPAQLTSDDRRSWLASRKTEKALNLEAWLSTNAKDTKEDLEDWLSSNTTTEEQRLTEKVACQPSQSQHEVANQLQSNNWLFSQSEPKAFNQPQADDARLRKEALQEKLRAQWTNVNPVKPTSPSAKSPTSLPVNESMTSLDKLKAQWSSLSPTSRPAMSPKSLPANEPTASLETLKAQWTNVSPTSPQAKSPTSLPVNESTASLDKLKAQWTSFGPTSLPAKSPTSPPANESTASLDKLKAQWTSSGPTSLPAKSPTSLPAKSPTSLPANESTIPVNMVRSGFSMYSSLEEYSKATQGPQDPDDSTSTVTDSSSSVSGSASSSFESLNYISQSGSAASVNSWLLQSEGSQAILGDLNEWVSVSSASVGAASVGAASVGPASVGAASVFAASEPSIVTIDSCDDDICSDIDIIYEEEYKLWLLK